MNDVRFKILVLKLLLVLLDRTCYTDGLDLPWYTGDVVKDAKRWIKDQEDPKK